ncbi:Hypothetical protein BDP_1632 [Bifidobacterium dentium Bd1]|uniref:Uncharacterized protein n=1 Tax=Bifidobacterium dentium (strain ATCC 27534 / DSM 20436 / JCM 1195 / Bd1) TaxID=401473 RepID=D2Q5L0_BIFDB|nr:Hypothetical protein BDP_1632 [Bifidobacterium dentium Bd1]
MSFGKSRDAMHFLMQHRLSACFFVRLFIRFALP